MMVFGVHLGQHITIPGSVGVFFSKGSTGVGFFFILSGYLAFVTLERLETRYSSFRLMMVYFWIRKMIRILPLYYLVIAFYFVFFSITDSVPKDSSGLYWIKYLLFLNTSVQSDNVFWNNLGAVWSISCFVFFYLIAPICYKAIRKYWISWGTVIISYGIMKCIDDRQIYNTPIRSLFYFFLGALAYLAVKEKKEKQIAIFLSILLLFCILTGGGTAIVAPCLAVMYIVVTRGVTISNKVLFRVINFLSMISYSIYLDHAAVIEVMDHLKMPHGLMYGGVLIASSFILAVITYNLVEKKFVDLCMGVFCKTFLEKVAKY